MDNDKKVEKESNDIEHVSYSEKDKNGDFSEVYGYYEEWHQAFQILHEIYWFHK